MVATLAWPTAAGAASAPGPPLTEPRANLDAAVECDAGIDTATRTPVLLVSGTAATSEGTWGPGYRHVLPARGFPTCSVELPQLGYGDAQAATEYVVHALRVVTARSGRDVAILGHSQAALEILWALRFWPDLAGRVTDVVTLAGAWNGSTQADALCGTPVGCFPAAWQLRPGSRFIETARREPLPVGPDYTSIATRNDEVVTPQPQASRIERGRNILVQDICSGRPVDHVLILSDAVSAAAVFDALGHDGPADPARIDRSVCAQLAMPGSDPVAGLAAGAQFLGNLLAGAATAPAQAEPPLRCYADPRCEKRGLEGSAPAVSPDGSTIAFVRAGDIAVAAGDGTVPRRLVATRGADDDPAFSADGEQLVWGRARRGRCDVLTARLDGTALRRITTSRIVRCHPVFAANGRVVFVDAPPAGGAADIYSVNGEGRARRRLTRTARGEADPTVSAAGLLAFVRPSGFRGETHVFTMPLRGGRVRRLTGGRGNDRDPAFSMDGRRVVFTRANRYQATLRVARLGGAGSRRVPTPAGRAGQPAYFPDGSVLFVRQQSRRTRPMLWRSSVDGRAQAVGS